MTETGTGQKWKRGRDKPLILLIDDDPYLHELIGVVLSALPCKMISALDGREGLLKYVEHRPDLIILDIDMPMVGGIEVLRRLRSHEKTRETPVIVVSGLSQDLREQLAQLGIAADAYFNKPFNYERLQAEVARLLGLEGELESARAEIVASRERDRLFAGFEMIDVLRTDALSTTWRALQKSLGRFVSLKVLTEEAVRLPEVTTALRRLARTLGRLNHPNIIRMYDHGETDFFHYVVLQYVDGVPLGEIVTQRTLSYEAVLFLVRKVCDGLQALHDNEIALYNLRPATILIDFSGEARIADFGLVSHGPGPLDLDQATVAEATEFPPYLAPEQQEAETKVTTAADIYALGAIIFELLAWKPYSEGADLREINPAVTASLNRMVASSLSADPAERPKTAAEIARVCAAEIPEMLSSDTRSKLHNVDFNPLRRLARTMRTPTGETDR